MGAKWSQLLRPIPYSCYELGHTWSPSCSASTLEVGLTCFEESLKIYSSVYVFSWLLRGQVPDRMALVTLLKNIVRSSAFLSYNAFFFVWAFCSLRKFVFQHNYFSFGWLSAWIASFLAILVERGNRRALLATYVSTVATESLISCAPETWPKIPHGEKLTFSVVSSVLLYIYKLKSDTDKKDFIFGVLRTLIGSEEEGCAARHFQQKGVPCRRIFEGNCRHFITALKNIFTFQKDPVCQHQLPCLLYALKGFVLPFVIGSVGQIGLDLAKYKSLHAFRHPANFVATGLSLGCFSAVFKVSSCFCRALFGADIAEASIPAGFLASLVSSTFYPSLSLSIYLLWKTIEIMCRRGVSQGLLPKVAFSVELLYATATAILFHLAVVRPHKLKPSYFKFMNRITGDRVSEVNRFLLDFEYPGASEAASVLRHVPMYDYSHFGDRMRQVWPQILRLI